MAVLTEVETGPCRVLIAPVVATRSSHAIVMMPVRLCRSSHNSFRLLFVRNRAKSKSADEWRIEYQARDDRGDDDECRAGKEQAAGQPQIQIRVQQCAGIASRDYAVAASL